MKSHTKIVITPIAAGLILAFGQAMAADDDADLKKLITPESKVEAGIGIVSNENGQRFGQYSGLNNQTGFGLLDLYFVKRDDGTGTWTKFTGRNLGLENREFRFEQSRQGNWGYFVDFSDTPRYDPFTVTTRNTGIGGAVQAINGAATASTYQLKTDRKAWTFGFDKEITDSIGIQVRYKDETKVGSRLFGQGQFTAWNFLAEPIDYRTQQFEGILQYTSQKLQLSGGYYGSIFSNANQALVVQNAFAALNPMALPPSNYSNQFNIAGGYNFTDTMRATFKAVRGVASQTMEFLAAPIASSGAANNLQGRVVNTQLQAGLSARPISDLTLRGDFRYDDRHDTTPVFRYFLTAATANATSDGSNEPRSIRTATTKVEGTYRLPMGFRLTAGVDFEEKKRNRPPVLSVDFREKTDETTVRLELRRAVSESVTGAVGYLHSHRGGSDWAPMVSNTNTSSPAGIAPLHLINRDRDTLRMTATWVPFDALSLNARFDVSRDTYTGRGIVAYDIGPKRGLGNNLSLDAGYTFSENLSATAWYSRNENGYRSAECTTGGTNVATSNTCIGPNSVWSSDVKNVANSWGAGLKAKVTPKIDVTADWVESKVKDSFGLGYVTGATSFQPLDNINTRVQTLKVAGIYTLDRQSAVRVFLVHDRYTTDDWTWSQWVYTNDGTTVRQTPSQVVNFLGAAYSYKFQ